MKKVLFLLSMCIAVGSAIFAQEAEISPNFDALPSVTNNDSNAELVESLNYQLKTLIPYNKGVMYSGTSANYDHVGVTNDGVNFSEIDKLVKGTFSKPSVWELEDIAFYYGQTEEQSSFGTELRVFKNNEASMLRNGGHGLKPAITNVERHLQGNGESTFYYLVQGDNTSIGGGSSAYLNQTNGTSESVIEINSDRQLYHTPVSERGEFTSFIDDETFHFVASTPGIWGNYSSVSKMGKDDDGNDFAYFQFADQGDVDVYNEVIVFDDYYMTTYDTNEGRYNAITFFEKGNFNNPTIINDYSFYPIKPVRSGDRVFAVGVTFSTPNRYNTSKLIMIEDKVATQINVNNEVINDNVKNLVLSGDFLYFTAHNLYGKTTLYSINTSDEQPTPIEVETLEDNFSETEVIDLISIPNGVALAIHTAGESFGAIFDKGVVKVFEAGTKGGYEVTNTSDWNRINNIAYNNNLLYFSVENDSKSGDDIYTHDFSVHNFKRSDVKFNINDSQGTWDDLIFIEGATLTFTNGIDSYDLESDANGDCELNNIKPGVYNYTLSANGFIKKQDSEEIYPSNNGSVQSVNLSLDSEELKGENAIQLTNKFTLEAIVGAQVTLVNGDIEISGVTNENGIAEFADAYYGTYDYTLSIDGFEVYTSTIPVASYTAIDNPAQVSLTPTASIEYGATGVVNSEDYPFIRAHVVLTHITEASKVYNIATLASSVPGERPMITLENIPYATYNYEYFAGAHASQFGTLVVDGDESIVIEFSREEDMIFEVIGNNGLLEGATISLTNLISSEPSFNGTTDENGKLVFERLPFGVYKFLLEATGYDDVTDELSWDEVQVDYPNHVYSYDISLPKNDFAVLVNSDNNNEPISNALITLVDINDNTNTYSGNTNADGILQFTDVFYGEYTYEISADDYLSVAGEHSVNETSEGITANLIYAYDDVSVSVMDADMIEIVEATVSLTSVSDESVHFTMDSNEAGIALFENVPFGEYNYVVSKADYNNATGTYILDENTTDGIDVVLVESLVDFTFTVVNRGEDLVEGATVSIRSTTNDFEYTALTDETGTVVITELPFDTYAYDVVAEDYQPMDGEYTVDADAETEFTITLDRRVGVDEVEVNASVYPNPVRDVLNIASDSPIEAIGIYALNGQKIREIKTGNLNQVRVSDLPSGIYLIKIFDINGNIILRKINKL